MTESDTTPTADEPQGTPPETSGSATPKSGATDAFAKGYGSGMHKGRREGATTRETEILSTLGFASLEDVQAALEERKAEESGKVAEGERQRRALERELKQLRNQVETLARFADEARLDRLRAAAVARGVGPGGQLDAFIAMHGAAVRWAADRTLEVVDGDVPTGRALEEWIDEALERSPFLRVPRNNGGAGASVQPASGPPANAKTTLFDVLGMKR